MIYVTKYIYGFIFIALIFCVALSLIDLSSTPEAVVQRCSAKKLFFEILQNLQENTCASVPFFKKVAGLSPLLKERLRHRCFPVNFAKLRRTPSFIEQLWWLLLQVSATTSSNVANLH